MFTKTSVVIATVATLALAASSAGAATVGHWTDITDWDAAAKTANLSFPDVIGFPQAALTSDSASGPGTGPISGASTWLAASTPPGAVYGTSRNRQYLNLRPAANNASAPSTSTYTFDAPTPSSGWSFALGDIDAEFLDVSAVGADGEPVAIRDLGFQSAFNYCTGAGTPTCSSAKPQPTPTFESSTARLAGPGVNDIGPQWSDTDGAAAWFSPTVSLRSLTIRSTWRAGLPTYQTWFGALSRDVTGTVTGTAECSAADLAVTLRDAGGDEVATTRTADDGTYSFAGLATRDDWAVDVAAPEGCEVDGDALSPADLSADDAVVDVTLQVVDDGQPPVDPDPEPSPDPADPDDPTGPDNSSTSPSTVGSPTVLPDTGGPDLRVIEAGAAMVLAGTAVLAIGRRRRRGSHQQA